MSSVVTMTVHPESTALLGLGRALVICISSRQVHRGKRIASMYMTRRHLRWSSHSSKLQLPYQEHHQRTRQEIPIRRLTLHPRRRPKHPLSLSLLHSADESDNESFCSDVSVVSERGRGCLRSANVKNGVRKNLKLKFNKKHDITRFLVHSDKPWSISLNRKGVGRTVSEKELRDRKWIEQIRHEEIRSMTKG